MAGKPAAGRRTSKASTGKLVPERPSPHKSTAPPTARAATGPTDMDPAEGMGLDEERQFIEDNKLYMQPLEMHAYKRVLKWVHNQPWACWRNGQKRARLRPLQRQPEKIPPPIVGARPGRSARVTPCDGKDRRPPRPTNQGLRGDAGIGQSHL